MFQWVTIFRPFEGSYWPDLQAPAVQGEQRNEEKSTTCGSIIDAYLTVPS